jgi:hypothetical protein
MEQLRLIIRSILFLAFTAVIYVMLLASVPQRLTNGTFRNLKLPFAGYGHTWSRFQEARTHEAVDILFIGSSHAYRGFDTRIFETHGYSSFNLGSSMQTPIQSEALLRRHLDELKPRLVVMTVHPISLSSDGVESSLDLLANGPTDAAAWSMAWHIAHLQTWNALLCSWSRKMVRGEPDLKEAAEKGVDTYIKGGFVERDHATRNPGKAIGPITASKKEDSRDEPLPLQFHALERIENMLLEEQCSLILVETPLTEGYRMPADEHEDLAQLLRHSGAHIDMTATEGINDSLHFYDKSHLNQHGVELFNRAFLERLKAEGLLP